MRLIDADALLINESEACINAQIKLSKKNASKTIDVERYINQLAHKRIHMLIADAPTIEPAETFEWCTDCKEYDQEKHCCHRWSKQIRQTVAELEEQYKPKRGEWIYHKNKMSCVRWNKWECSVCHKNVEHKTDFCPSCGAEMK